MLQLVHIFSIFGNDEKNALKYLPCGQGRTRFSYQNAVFFSRLFFLYFVDLLLISIGMPSRDEKTFIDSTRIKFYITSAVLARRKVMWSPGQTDSSQVDASQRKYFSTCVQLAFRLATRRLRRLAMILIELKIRTQVDASFHRLATQRK